MRVITYGQQLGLDGPSVPVGRLQFERSLDELRLLVDAFSMACEFCGRKRMERHCMGPVELFDTPWPDTGRLAYYCSDECFEKDSSSSGWSDFGYFSCEHCYRLVCERNPANGYMGQYRIVDECDQICLRCYEESLLESGQPDEDYDSDVIKGGMFFNRGNPELEGAGYECLIPERRIAGGPDVDRWNTEAREHIAKGYQLVTAFESMGIGGGEGYISLYGKHREGE